MVDASDDGPFRGDQALHFEGEVIEEGGVVLPFRFLPVAGLAQQAHPLLEKHVQPGLQPEARANAQGHFAEGLGRGVGKGHSLVVGPPWLAARMVAQQVGIQLNGEGPRVDEAALHPHPHQPFGPEVALKFERVTEVGGGHLAAPARDGPGIGLPFRDGGQGRCAAQGFWGGQGGGRGQLQIQILGTAVEIQHAVDVVHLADALQQAVAQPAGLKKLLPPLKAHAARGEEGAGGGIELDPVGLEPSPRQVGGDMACADVALELGVVFLLVADQLQLQGDRSGRIGMGHLGQALPLGRAWGLGWRLCPRGGGGNRRKGALGRAGGWGEGLGRGLGGGPPRGRSGQRRQLHRDRRIWDLCSLRGRWAGGPLGCG